MLRIKNRNLATGGIANFNPSMIPVCCGSFFCHDAKRPTDNVRVRVCGTVVVGYGRGEGIGRER